MKSKLTAVLLSFGILTAVTPEQALANAEDMGLYTINKLTSNDSVHDILPSLNVESTVVWQREVPCSQGENPCLNDYEIFTYSPADGIMQVTNNDLEDYFPEINESGTIVWMSRLNADDDWEIWRKDPNSPNPVQMTDNDLDDKYPQISDNGNIVWNTFDGTDWEISYATVPESTENLWSSTETLYGGMNSGSSGGTDYTVTDNEHDDYLTSGYMDYFQGELDYTRPYKDNAPRISPDGKIAWMADDGQDFEIWNYDPSTQKLLQVTSNDVDDRYPQINAAGNMAWEKFDGSDYGIAYTQNSSSPEKYISINEETDNVWDDVHPKLNESGDVAWQSYDGSDWEIGRYNAATDQSKMVTDDTYDHLYHTMNNNGDLAWLTWAPQENSNEPFVLNFFNNALDEFFEITTFMSYFPYPRLNDNREITWWESEWHGYDIAVAKPNNPLHVKFHPSRLDKNGKIKLVKAVLELPSSMNIENIDVTTLCLRKVNNIEVDDPVYISGRTKIDDFNDDGIDDLLVQFIANDLLSELGLGSSELFVSGRFIDGTPFYGKGMVKVKEKTNHKRSRKR